VIIDGGGGECLVDRTPAEGTFSRGALVSPALELQVHAGAFGEVGDGVGEVEGLEIHDELDGVAAPLTAKAVIEAAVRGDAEGRSFFLVVRVGAEADEAGSLAPEGGELGGYLDDVGRLPDLLYAAV
jgi:hypothetical protein